MGYSTRNNGQIKDFQPDNDENTLYVAGSMTFEELSEAIIAHFGDVTPDQITIESEYIHTSCITYDLYDPGDYTNFIIIRKTQEKQS